MNKIKNIFNKTFSFFSFYLLAFATAYADYDIGGPDSGPFAAVVAFIQDVVNLIDGPVALAFSFFSIAGMAFAWAVAPKWLSAMGVFARVTIAVIIVLNIGAWIAAYQS